MKYIEDIDLGDEFGPVQIEVRPDDVIDFCKTWIRDEENSKNIFNAAPTRFTDEEFAKSEGLPGAIVPGIMSCLLYTSPSPRDKRQSRMPSSA